MEFNDIDYAVDACSYGNPGGWGFRCVHINSRVEIFRKGIFEDGTNNIGEYVAVVYALSHFTKLGKRVRIYTDSTTALAWIRNKCHNSNYKSPNPTTKKILIDADMWLRDNNYEHTVIKWNTRQWGDNPADYGRK